MICLLEKGTIGDYWILFGFVKTLPYWWYWWLKSHSMTELQSFLSDSREETGTSIKAQTIKENIDFDPKKKVIFNVLVALTISTGLAILVLLVVWTLKFTGGYDWFNVDHRFSFHPLLMVSSLVVITGFSKCFILTRLVKAPRRRVMWSKNNSILSKKCS